MHAIQTLAQDFIHICGGPAKALQTMFAVSRERE